MLVLFEPSGGYSNRLFQAVHAEAWCLKRNQVFVNLTFDDLLHLYPHAKKSFGIKLIYWFLRILDRYKYKVPLGYIGIVDFESFESAAEKEKQLEKFRLNFIKGWYFRNDIVENRDYFKQKYELDKRLYLTNEFYRQFSAVKSNYDIVLGLHLRRGDYKTWMDGRFYYSFDQYAKIHESFLADARKRGLNKVLTVVFSNEDLSGVTFSGDILKSSEEWYLDHRIMGECDYLVGPPSTFTMWASYTVNSKLIVVYNPDMNVNMDKTFNYEMFE
jgi:hypothetical protein